MTLISCLGPVVVLLKGSIGRGVHAGARVAHVLPRGSPGRNLRVRRPEAGSIARTTQ